MVFALPPLTELAWQRLLDGDAGGSELYGPLRASRDIVLGRAAQSLDGFIATRNGASRWISGPDDILHTHRLRALCDAVVVGASTVLADDPRLTTRACAGPSPVRVVIDPRRRLSTEHLIFGGGPKTFLIAGQGSPRHGNAETVLLRCDPERGMASSDIVAALAERGLRRLLIEGGGRTVSRFLRAGALDRLHVTVAPVLLGDGIRALDVPPCDAPGDARRLGWTAYALGADVLLDIAL